MKIKYLSLNILRGGILFDEMLGFLKREDADIVALQEVYNGHGDDLARNLRSFDELREALSYEHTVFAPAYRDANFGGIEQGQAIFSKFPILSRETIWYDMPFEKIASSSVEDAEFAPRNLLYCTIRANCTVLNVFNTHGIWGRDGDDNPRRFAMVDTILKTVGSKQNVILSGDFNLKNTTLAVRKLREQLFDVFGDELISSFNMRQKTDPRFASIVVDMIFVSPDIKVLEKYCPPVDISDHLPLIANFEVAS